MDSSRKGKLKYMLEQKALTALSLCLSSSFGAEPLKNDKFSKNFLFNQKSFDGKSLEADSVNWLIAAERIRISCGDYGKVET
jgi:hypothetical protein